MGMTWTDEQKKVIDVRERNILVSAAAGSGKTAVLVERIISMITDKKRPVDIDQLLVVTYTKAAAAEMKERIRRALEKKIDAQPGDDNLEKQIALLSSAQIATTHSFCLHVIRNHFNEIDLDPSFRVADDIELSLLKADTVNELLEDMYEAGSEAFLSFVECYAHGKTDHAIEELMMQLYNYSRSYPWPEEWLEHCMSFLEPASVEEMENTELITFLKDYIHSIVKDLVHQTEAAISICRQPDGPVHYEPALLSDKEWLERVLKAERFAELKMMFDSLSWESLSKKRMPEVPVENKEAVKDIRKSVKGLVEEVKKDFFFTDIEHMWKDIRMTAAPMAVLVDLVKEFSKRFQAVKEEKNIVDFGDLEHFALNILINRDENGVRKKSGAALELSHQFVEILCDEYQDSNLVQETILNAVSREDQGQPNIFMVGDVKQSIYKFRLARPELFMEKYNRYPVTDGMYQRIDLHKNFRSRSCVVDFVNLIFEHIMGETLGGIVYDERAALYKGASFPPLQKESPETDVQSGKMISDETELLLIDLKEDETLTDAVKDEKGSDKEIEARAVAARIHQMMSEHYQILDKDSGQYRTLKYKDIVVLLRTMRGWSDVFSDVLTKAGIPAFSEISSGFFDTLEIRTAVCMLSIIDNPIQDIELAAVLKSCIGGFSDEALAMVRCVLKKGSLYDACISFMKSEADMILDNYFQPAQYLKVRERMKDFFAMLDRFRVQASYMSIHQLILSVFEETKYDELISAMPFGERRHANLELFIEKAVDYERTSYKGLFNFIRYIRKLRTQDNDFGEASVVGEAEDAVRIVSIHKSKGLEYPVVFVCGLNKPFNKQDAKSSVLIHSDYGLGPAAVNEETRVVSPTIYKKAIAKKIVLESLGEELRVLYVALTRAKERLILTGTVKDFEKAKKQWLRAACTGGGLLSFKDLTTASGFLDWIMPVLYNENYRKQSNAKVDIKVMPMMLFIAEQMNDIAGNSVKRGALAYEIDQYKKIFDPAAIEKRFGWVYPSVSAVNLPAKLTISEIKKLYSLSLEMSEGEKLFEMPEDIEIPKDIQMPEDTKTPADGEISAANEGQDNALGKAMDKEQRILAAARRGSAMHKILELADFSAIRCLEDVRRMVVQCVQAGAVDADLAAEINPWKIFNLTRSPLGQRMAAAQKAGHLYREKQFIMAVAANEIFKETNLESAEETILTQGIIDAFFEEKDGIILVDYKTDFVRKGQAEVLINRYKVQLDYYQKAIERMLHKAVKQRYIYSFALEMAIEV